MLFVMNAMRNIQKPKRDQEINDILELCNLQLCVDVCGVLQITWEVNSGQNV